MKKIIILTGISLSMLVFSKCNPARKTSSTTTPTKVVNTTTYEGHLSPLIMSHCTPCHIPLKGGNKKAYDNYANVKGDIDEIIRRIELHPGEKGFMPFKKARLSDSTITVFKQFKMDGMQEK